MGKRIVIIGAGPIGLEAALYGTTLGHDVRVFERVEVGGNVRDWGHVRMFSPWKMNTTPLGRSKLKSSGWNDDDSPTGREFVVNYLQPLSAIEELAGRIFTGTTVVQVGRQQHLKHDLIGDPKRAESPFRILVRHASGKEVAVEADVMLDASGVYSNPGYMGDGGIPAVGELANRHRIMYRIEDILGRERSRYARKTTLVVGSGHSAATTVVALRALCETEPGTRVVWAVRANKKQPYEVDDRDPLIERASLLKQANEIAETLHPQIQYLAGHSVQSIAFQSEDERFEVTLHSGLAPLTLHVDRIIAQVGLGPDNSLYRALQVHECYATRGPMQLAAALLGENANDCLAQNTKGAEVLRTSEPNFFIIGHKSYGTRPNFLLRIGHEQVRDVFRLIHGDPRLDLYSRATHEPSVSATPLAR